MVPSELEDRLRRCYEALQAISINVNSYDDVWRDVVFDLVTVDAFIAGIVSRLLESGWIGEEEKGVLRHQFLIGEKWDGHQVHNVELGRATELLDYAKAIEFARLLCIAAMDGNPGARNKH